MRASTRTIAGLAAALSLASVTGAQAQDRPVHKRPAGARAASADREYRPLTIGRHAGMVTRGPHAGLIVRRNEIYAPGGFSAHGYGYGRPNGEAAIRAAQNADVRYRTAGVYGYGLDGVGGIGFGDGLETGYNNPTAIASIATPAITACPRTLPSGRPSAIATSPTTNPNSPTTRIASRCSPRPAI